MSGDQEIRAQRIAEAFAEAHGLGPVDCPVSFANLIDDLIVPSGRTQSTAAPLPVSDIGPTGPFADTVYSRRSRRQLLPPRVGDVGLVVARAGLTHDSSLDTAGARFDRSPAPSAGGRHPLSLVVLARDVVGLDAGGWVLDPDAALLRPSAYTSSQVGSAFDAIAMALHLTEPPPAAIVAVAHPDRTLTRYPDGISLLWREVGALLMLVHLAATDIGLGSCIVGTCGVLSPPSDSASQPVDVGAVAVGALPSDD